MAKSVLSAPHFQNEEAAFAYVEAKLWPTGPVCPFCGERERIGVLNGKTTRPGLRKCYACKKPFTVRIGTIFESSHLALHLWLQVIHLMGASKKGISTRQIQRMLQCSMKTAWFLTHRIREAMAPTDGAAPLGGLGKIVEADETEIVPSRKSKVFNRSKRSLRPRFVALVERDGKVRSKVITEHGMHEVRQAVRDNLAEGSILHTDGAQAYKFLMPIGQHASVDHDKMFVRDSNNGRVHVNTAEGYFSIFKRGLVGTYQHMGSQHLHRYLAEFDFRANTREKLGFNDVSRAEMALQGFKGKRLTYETTGAAQ